MSNISRKLFIEFMTDATKKWKAEAEKWMREKAKEIIKEELQKMNKEQQDKLWKELSEESKKAILKKYNELTSLTNEGCAVKIEYEQLFGPHNLNPKPTPKTWEEVEKLHKDYYYIGGETSDISDALKLKAIATLKIAKLINLGYGGMVSEEEWKDDNIEKFCIVRSLSKIEYCHLIVGYEFIAFHTPEQREEFMSYESNRKLVEQYYMM